MANTIDSDQEDHKNGCKGNIGKMRFGDRANPSRQYMMGKLFDYRKRLQLIVASSGSTESKKIMIAACKDYLDAIEETVFAKGILWKKKSFTAWHLFHRLDETMYLLMELPELKAQAFEMVQGLKQSTLPQQSKTEWQMRIQNVLDKLDKPETPPGEKERQDLAYLLNSAAYGYNDCVDNLFWDLWCKKFVALIHATMLIGLVCVFVLVSCNLEGIRLCMPTVLLLGAMGGLGSGILTFQPVAIAYGHFWGEVLYQACIRPIQGAMAALMTFWLLQSQYLIAIDPPLKPGTTIVSCVKGHPCELPAVMGRQGSINLKDGAFTVMSSAKAKNPAITLQAAEGMQIYLYLLVLLVAGFSGDKLLKTVTDKVSNRLFAEAEKTKDGK